MENIIPNSVDIQNTIDNFEAVVAAGNVKLINQNEDVKLYIDADGIEYIYNGGNAYSEGSEEFARMKAEYFGTPNAE